MWGRVSSEDIERRERKERKIQVKNDVIKSLLMHILTFPLKPIYCDGNHGTVMVSHYMIFLYCKFFFKLYKMYL